MINILYFYEIKLLRFDLGYPRLDFG